MSTQVQQQLTEAQIKTRRREGIPDRVIRAKAKEVGWKRSEQTIDQFMFQLHWVKYGTGKDARWFEIKWE
jgi:hypothetical protein